MPCYVWYVRGYKTKIGYVRKVLCVEKKAALCTWYVCKNSTSTVIVSHEKCAKMLRRIINYLKKIRRKISFSHLHKEIFAKFRGIGKGQKTYAIKIMIIELLQNCLDSLDNQ